jgi:hypothetical protein
MIYIFLVVILVTVFEFLELFKGLSPLVIPFVNVSGKVL